MTPEESKKLNDTIAFTNSHFQQFSAFRETVNQEIMNLEAENNNLKTLINANRSWIQICDSAIKELKKNQHSHEPKKTFEIKPEIKSETPIKINWKWWK